MTKTEFIKLATNIIGVIALVLVAFGVLQPDGASNQPTARGTSNFNEIDLDDGTAADPAYGFTSDTDTGMYRIGANNLGFGVGGSNAVNITSSGVTFAGSQTLNGNVVITGTLDVTGNTVITGTTDLVGNVSDSGGDLTFADNIAVTGTSDLQGNISDSAGALTVADNAIIDGAADAIQLIVQGNATQTSSLQVWEQSDGTDVGTMSNAGLLDISGELNYGSSNFSVLGYASAGEQIIVGTASVTGTLAAPHGLTTVTFCVATLGEDPTAGAGDAAMVTVAVATNVCTLKVWQDDFVTAATETGVSVHWLVIGTP